MTDVASPTASWSFPTSVHVGAGLVGDLAATCAQHGISRPFVVTDPGFVNLPAFASVMASLPPNTAVFSDVQPNPVGANVGAGTEVFRHGNHDGVIAVGGGSALDAGKVIAFHARQTRPLWDFEDAGDNWTRADSVTQIAAAAPLDPSASGKPIPLTESIATRSLCVRLRCQRLTGCETSDWIRP